jgi:hypothetical protein
VPTEVANVRLGEALARASIDVARRELVDGVVAGESFQCCVVDRAQFLLGPAELAVQRPEL